MRSAFLTVINFGYEHFGYEQKNNPSCRLSIAMSCFVTPDDCHSDNQRYRYQQADPDSVISATGETRQKDEEEGERFACSPL